MSDQQRQAPLRLGISSYGIDAGARAAVDLAVAAEAAGFDRFMLVERVFTNDTLAALAGAAARTSRIGLGTGIANIWLRHPQMLAASAIAVADISGGRLVLGLGPNNRAGTEAAGFAWRDPRLVLSEVTDTLRGCFAGTEGRCGPAPYPIPLPWAAVALETVSAAALHADGVMLYLATDARVAKARDRFVTEAAAAGRDPAALEVSVLLPVFLHDQVELAREAARAFLRPYAAMAHYQKLFRASGFDDPTELSDDLIDAVVAVGDGPRCSQRIEALAAAGLTHIDLAPLPVDGRTVADVAGEVMAALGPPAGGTHR